MSRISLSITLGICLLFSPALPAQSNSARLEGTITEPSGGVVQGARVLATEDGTGWITQVSSDDRGHFIFPALRAAGYTISVSARGFRKAVRKQVWLSGPGSRTENFILQKGNESETEQEIQTGKPLQLTDSQISAAFTPQELQFMPLLDRDPLSLVAYQPGILIAGGDEQSSTVSGTRTNRVALDGVTVSDPVNPRLGFSFAATNTDTINQVRVVAASGSAEFGQSAGTQVMLITRSGTNSWSRSVYEYFRSRKLSANDYFTNFFSYPEKPDFLQNLYGVSISGPLRKDRTLLFANFEGRRTQREKTVNSLVLTEEAKAGTFQWYTPGTTKLQSFDIVANDPRKIGIDPVVKSLLANVPDPNYTEAGDGLNIGGYRFNTPIDSSRDQVTVRIDHAVNNAHRLFSRFSWDRSSAADLLAGAEARFPGEEGGKLRGSDWGFVIGSDWTLSPRMVNELRAGHQNSSLDSKRPSRTTAPMIIPNAWTAPLDASFPKSSDFPVTEVSDSLTFLRGRHIFKAGVMFRRTLQNTTDAAGSYPDVTFGGSFGNLPPASVGPSDSTVISASDRQMFEKLYNDLLGRVEQVTQTFYSDLHSFLPAGSARVRSYDSRDYAVFLQDDWKIRPNFTFNLGLRYELSSVPREVDGLQGMLDQASQAGNAARISGFTVQPGNVWYGKDTNDFGPRFGFAWDVTQKGTTVLRGSYGIFYDRPAGRTINFVDQNTPAFSQVVSLHPNASGTDKRLSEIALPAAPAAPELKPSTNRAASAAIFDPNLRSGYVQHFNLTLQRQILDNTVVEAGYAGARGNKLFMNLDLNQTRVEEDFIQSFMQLRDYRTTGVPVPASNTLAKMFGSPRAAIDAIGGSNLDLGLVGAAANIVDRNYYTKYAAAGVSDFYLRNFPQFDRFIFGTNAGRSWYDSLRAGLRRSTDYYSLSAHYTWSKSLDTNSWIDDGFASSFDSFNPRSNKAPADTDRKHVFSAFGTYRLGSESRFLGGWHFGLMGIWETGRRFSVSSGRETAYGGVNSLADFSGSRIMGSLIRDYNGVFWFAGDEAARFTVPGPGGKGTSGRNSFVGPGYFNIDASIVKSFRVNPRNSVMFRMEWLNVLNHPNFGLPGTNLSDSSFSRIDYQQGSPRAIQLAVRYFF